jgi:hypothetical protein
MEKRYFTLGAVESNKLVKLFQIIFGIVCIGLALFWMIFNVRALKSDFTLWITVLFLSGFGFYQVWAGIGRATRFIELGSGNIRLKNSILMPPVDIKATEILKLELYPLSLIFLLKSGKKIRLRFGTTYHETNEEIVNALLLFSETYNVDLEIKEDKL